MACQGCRSVHDKFELAMAFQPIVDVISGEVFAYEALVRGANGEGAPDILSLVTPENRYAFDQQCRVAAIEGAVEAGLLNTNARLSINFLPNAVYSPAACIQLTLKTAAAAGMPLNQLIFEFTEGEEMADTGHVKNIVDTYRQMGFATAIDDFGAGYAGLGLLVNFQTDFIKLDMELIRGIDVNVPRRMVVSGIVRIAESLGITVIAEGVESAGEYQTLVDLGVRYTQGFFIARPGFRRLPVPQESTCKLAAVA